MGWATTQAWDYNVEKMSETEFMKQTRRIDIVSRRGQPQVSADVRRLKEQAMGGPVSSSWIAALYWKGSWAVMELINGYSYNIVIPFEIFEQWYYAHSKGTFFNGNVKDKYKIVRFT